MAFKQLKTEPSRSAVGRSPQDHQSIDLASKASAYPSEVQSLKFDMGKLGMGKQEMKMVEKANTKLEEFIDSFGHTKLPSKGTQILRKETKRDKTATGVRAVENQYKEKKKNKEIS
mmetsp:Transcript_22661/g.34958  ORF Transcript_22661/g.34958 Transcript_22661/m.34958 type:complete len:116 (+) Transcript_22661:1430-1777(+)